MFYMQRAVLVPTARIKEQTRQKKTVGLSVANHGNKGPPFSLALP